nr:acetyltransferase GNAT family protein 3 [Ischnura senegalensis]
MDSSLDSLYRAFSCCWYAWQGPRWSATRRRGGEGDKDAINSGRGAVGDGGIQEEGGGGCGGIGGGACEGGGSRGAEDDDDTPSTDTTGARIRYETLAHQGGGAAAGGGAGGGCDRSEEILHLLRHSFFREESLVSSVGCSWTSGAAGSLLPALAHRILRQGVSVAAVEEESGRVVGIAVNLIVHRDDSSTHPYRLLQDHLMPERNSKLHDVAHFLRDLQAGQFERAVGGRAGCRDLCVLLVNVERHYAGRGIGRELLARSVAIARASKVDRVVGHATGEAAPRIYAFHGFQPTREMRATPGAPRDAAAAVPAASQPVVARLYAKEMLTH